MARKAVLVGLNAYPDAGNRLRGCLNDVRQVRALLEEHFAFSDEAVEVLTDSRATTRAIRERLQWLVRGARAGDVLVFHYSGHGSQVPDTHGDEPGDGLDEIICPYDLDWDDPFTDDDLHEIFEDVPPGVNLTVILDCCHAGTGLRDFEESRRTRGLAGKDARPRCLRPPARVHGRSAAPSPIRRFGHRAVEAGAILLAACRDDQVSADAFIDHAYHGALTFYLCRAIADAGYSVTYRGLLKAVRRLLLDAGFEQQPQLEAPAGLDRAELLAPLLQPA